MTAENVSLAGVRSLQMALERLPNGRELIILLRRMGFWTANEHDSIEQRKPFNRKISSLNPMALSDEMSYWTAEFGRILEVYGIVQGQSLIVKQELKIAQAKARVRLRKEREEENGKPLSVSDLKDASDEDPAVADLYEREIFIIYLLSSISAVKEATQQYIASLSREISFRDAQMKAGVYG